jgi:hypothetical protein
MILSEANRPLPNSIDVDKFVTVSPAHLPSTFITARLSVLKPFPLNLLDIVESFRNLRDEKSPETSLVSILIVLNLSPCQPSIGYNT